MIANIFHDICISHAKQNISTHINLLPIILIAIFCGCTSKAEYLKSEILNASIKSKTKIISFDTSVFFPEKIKKICIQRQYMTEKSFADLTKMPTSDFKNIKEGEFILWIYFESKSSTQVRLKTSEITPQKIGQLCTNSSIFQINQEAIIFN